MQESMTPLGIRECMRAIYRRQRRGEIGDPCGVPTETGANALED